MSQTLTYTQALRHLHKLFPTIDIHHIHTLLQQNGRNLQLTYNACAAFVQAYNTHARSYVPEDELAVLRARQATMRSNIQQTVSSGEFAMSQRQQRLIPKLHKKNKLNKNKQQRVATTTEIAAVTK